MRGWDRRNAYYFALISALANHYGFELETPWRDLPEATREALLFGSGDDSIEFRYLGERGRAVTRRHPFEGIVPCGIEEYGVTSLHHLGLDADMAKLDAALEQTFPDFLAGLKKD